MKICVLFGGASPERAVSIQSGLAVGGALEELDYDVLYLDPVTPLNQMNAFLESIRNVSEELPDFESLSKLKDEACLEHIIYCRRNKIDLVFNALHGGHGEDGSISGLLNIAEIPYTGSGMAASAAAMNKRLSKLIAHAVGVRSAKAEYHYQVIKKPDSIDFPLVVKPNDSGSSVGLHILRSACDLTDAATDALKYSDFFIIEEYIPGREFDVPVLAGKAYPIVEVNPHGDNDYKAKYLGHKTDYFVPARLTEKQTAQMQNAAEKVYRALGLSNYARVDFRMTEKGEIFFLEANTLPGMTATSLVPKSGKAAGLSFSDIVDFIVKDALK